MDSAVKRSEVNVFVARFLLGGIVNVFQLVSLIQVKGITALALLLGIFMTGEVGFEVGGGLRNRVFIFATCKANATSHQRDKGDLEIHSRYLEGLIIRTGLKGKVVIRMCFHPLHRTWNSWCAD